MNTRNLKQLAVLGRLAGRNLRRNPTRTGLTVGMVTVGVALLVVGQSWIDGMMGGMLRTATDAAGHVRLVDPGYARREALAPLDKNLRDVQELANRLRKTPGVVEVVPRITTGVTVSTGEEIGDLFAQVIGAPESYLRVRLGLSQRLVAGRWLGTAADDMVMGAKVAEQAGARVGDEVLLLGVTQDGAMSPLKGRLVGIVKGPSASVDQQIFLPLERVQWLTDMPGGATELLVYGGAYQGGVQLADQLRRDPVSKGLDVSAWSDREPWASMTRTVDAERMILLLIVGFLTAIGIWNTVVTSVLERTHEIGVLRALGLSAAGAVALFVIESLAVGLVGGVCGALLGAWPAWLLQEHGIHLGAGVADKVSMPMAETVYGLLSVEILVTAFVLGLVITLLGSFIPALRAARILPVVAMRSGR
ncbi:MAG: ABC transporter permease [Myxococcota bacterium]